MSTSSEATGPMVNSSGDTELSVVLTDEANPWIQQLLAFAFLPAVCLVNLVVIINIFVDLKEMLKVHLVFQLGLLFNDALSSVAGTALIALRRKEEVFSLWLCPVLVFMLRFGMMLSSAFVTLLALERYANLAAPFWYERHATVRTALASSVATVVAISTLTGLTFLDSTSEGKLDLGGHVTSNADNSSSGNGRDSDSDFSRSDHLLSTTVVPANTTASEGIADADLVRDDCFVITTSDFMMIFAVVCIANSVLTIFFNAGTLRTLREMQARVSGMVDGMAGDNNRDSSDKVLWRLVLVLSITSIASKFPFAVLTALQVADISVWKSLSSLISGVAVVGFIADPFTILVCTGRYRRRIRTCLARLRRCLFNRADVSQNEQENPVSVVLGIDGLAIRGDSVAGREERSGTSQVQALNGFREGELQILQQRMEI